MRLTCELLRGARSFCGRSLLTACGVSLFGCTDAPQVSKPTPSERGANVALARSPRSSHPEARLPRPEDRTQADPVLRPGDWFEDVTARSGIDFSYRDGQESAHYTLLESVGGGVAAFDFDNDGDLDLLFAGGGSISVDSSGEKPVLRAAGRPPGLFRNEGDWKFADVTAAAGLDDSGLYSHGLAVADFDRDGWSDFLVTGWRGVRLYRNRHDGTFEDVAEHSGVRCPTWGLSAAWADVNNDGWPDLYITTYARYELDADERCITTEGFRDVCGPSGYPGERDFVFLNLGDGRFEDATERAGLVPKNRGMGVVATDFDADGWIDFYICNDVEDNLLYFGGSSFPFVERAALAGAATSASGEREGSMGVTTGDYDRDGRPDLWYTNFAHQDNTLLRNAGNRLFENRTETSGAFGRSRPWVGWGTALVDLDSDGWEDLVVLNGHVRYETKDSPYFQPSQLFRNRDGKTFEEVTADGGPWFRSTHAARGLAVADLDNDGAPDLVTVHQNEPVAILRNRRAPQGWVRAKLQGTRSNLDAIGARVTVTTGDRTIKRWIAGGGSYLSHGDTRLLVPIDPSTTATAEVTWPGGVRETFAGLAAGRQHLLVEGQGESK